jgi:hypothetical protein
MKSAPLTILKPQAIQNCLAYVDFLEIPLCFHP